MIHTNSNLYATFPAADHFHRVLVMDCGFCSVVQQQRRRTGRQANRQMVSVNVLWLDLCFLDGSDRGTLLRTGVRLSAYRNGPYGRLLAALGLTWVPPPQVKPPALIGRTLLVRLEHVEHVDLGLAARVIEVQPDYCEQSTPMALSSGDDA